MKPHLGGRNLIPLYSCANESCATEHSWPADDLIWWPWDDRAGWYCEFCWDEFPDDMVERASAAGFRTISLRDHLAELDDEKLRAHVLRKYGS